MAASALSDALVGSDQQVDSRTDHELVAAVNAGDPDAFDALYFRYRDWVAGLAARFTGDEDLALDAMQETFLYLLRKFPGFRLTASMKTFLYPAVKNLSIAARKKAARYQSSEGSAEALERAPAPPAPPGGDDLAAVLAGLSEEHRETLLLRFVDGLSLAEIAVALEVPLGTVKSRLHNALAELRRDPRTREFFEQ
ncbi:MAG TPA: sigma-70 family RNA polymerase sigma factor [Verrucomicrobiota bacterium]|nr:sigma-70 family RNA polymerase sigma factor [Verrucomicrobiota bacterium]HOP97035.1 sigma-70 family RNA polymerase sigma factor [Verrucomicrobiota bacterium]